MYTSIDLFSGPGGLATGLKWAGITPLIAVEWSDRTVETYKNSHGADVIDLLAYKDIDINKYTFLRSDKTILIHGDIRNVLDEFILKILKERFNTSTVDLVTGGAPCESFSQAGQRKEDDERNTLFLNVTRISRAVNSKMFMFENVKGLLSKKMDGKKGEMYNAILQEFEYFSNDRPNYRLASRDPNVVLLKSSDYGVPQVRERIFLVGINRETDIKFKYPKKTHTESEYVTVSEALMDLPKLDAGEGDDVLEYIPKYEEMSSKQLEFVKKMHAIDENFPSPSNIQYDNKKITYHKAVNHREKMINRMTLINQGEGMKQAVDRLNKEGKKNLISKYFPKKIYAARNRRLDPNKPSFTVTSHCLDEMIHPIYNRGLTPREAARLQSFPDWYDFSGPYVKFHGDVEQDKYEQIGDAIPPLMGYALGKEIYKALHGNSKV